MASTPIRRGKASDQPHLRDVELPYLTPASSDTAALLGNHTGRGVKQRASPPLGLSSRIASPGGSDDGDVGGSGSRRNSGIAGGESGSGGVGRETSSVAALDDGDDEAMDDAADHDHLSSDRQTFVNTLISFVGAGILGLPYAFRQGGMAMSTAVLLIVGGLSLYCMLLLVECRRWLVQLSGGKAAAQTYGDICYEALGGVGLVAAEASLVITQSGFSIAYLIFIASNLNALWGLPRDPVVAACLPALAVLCCARQMKYLSPFSLLAEVVNLVGLGVVYASDIEYAALHRHPIEAWRWAALPAVFGVSVYCFEGMGMVLPLEKNMTNKRHFAPILTLVMTIYTLLCVTSGAMGYLAYGEETKDIIVLNLESSGYGKAVKLSFCVGLYFTFPVMVVPVWEVLELRWLNASAPRYERHRSLLRGAWVVGMGAVAAGMPGFGAFLSLIGSSGCSLLALILPPACHSVLARRVGGWSVWRDMLHVFITIGGVVSAVVGTVDAAKKMLHPEK